MVLHTLVLGFEKIIDPKLELKVVISYVNTTPYSIPYTTLRAFNMANVSCFATPGAAAKVQSW